MEKDSTFLRDTAGNPEPASPNLSTQLDNHSTGFGILPPLTKVNREHEHAHF